MKIDSAVSFLRPNSEASWNYKLPRLDLTRVNSVEVDQATFLRTNNVFWMLFFKGTSTASANLRAAPRKPPNECLAFHGADNPLFAMGWSLVEKLLTAMLAVHLVFGTVQRSEHRRDSQSGSRISLVTFQQTKTGGDLHIIPPCDSIGGVENFFEEIVNIHTLVRRTIKNAGNSDVTGQFIREPTSQRFLQLGVLVELLDVVVISRSGAKGGFARGKALSRIERQESARKAAQARWSDQIPTALRSGTIQIGDLPIDCAVLPDGTRVLSERALTKAFGGKRGGAHWRRKRAGDAGANLPNFLSAKNISTNIPNDLVVALSEPLLYRTGAGGGIAHGLEAKLLPKVCRALRQLKNEDKLIPSQEAFAAQAEIIADGLTEVGIIGLIDEATGYQEIRDKHALQEILDQFLRKTLATWAKRFPDEFYFHIFRLRGWEWKGRKVNPPQIVAHYTKDFVYYRLAPNLVEALDKKNPVINGRRRSANTQWFTEDVGDPALVAHLNGVVALMRVAKNWDHLQTMLDEAFPRQDETIRLPLFQTDEKQTEPPAKDYSIETLPLFAQLGSAEKATT